MATPDGARPRVFNGEIDNFREHAGRSSRDTASTSARRATPRWRWRPSRRGAKRCFARFQGMWAIVIADLRRRRLVGARDHAGVSRSTGRATDRASCWPRGKQILEARTNGRVRAGAGALAARPAPAGPRRHVLRGHPRRAARDVVRGRLRRHTRAAPSSEFAGPRGVHAMARSRSRPHLYGRLASGCAACAVAVVASRTWPSPSATTCLLSRAGSAPRCWPRCWLLAPGGINLSSGHLLVRDARRPRSSCRGVDGTRSRGPAKPNHRTGLDAGWLRPRTPRAPCALENRRSSLATPFAGIRVFQLCREHGATVVLDGHGADEVGGYPYHQRTLLLDRARRLRLGALARETRAIARRAPRERVGGPAERKSAASPPRARPLPPGWTGLRRRRRRRVPRRPDRPRSRSVARQPPALRRRVGQAASKIVLAFSDRNSMAHSVEARVPYLWIAAWSGNSLPLPDDYKAGGGQHKHPARLARRTSAAI